MATISAAMEVFKMDSPDGTPCVHFLLQDVSEVDTEKKKDILATAVRKIVDKFVDMSIVHDKDEKRRKVDGV